ncbi:MAG: cytochrome c [Pseudomonadota bacterium]
MNLNWNCAFGAAAALALSHSLTAVAHDGATGVVEQRMDRMAAIGDANKALRAMFSGETPYDADAVAEHAQTIGSQSGEAVTTLFPEGSLEGPTEANPQIWDDWDEFVRLADRLGLVAEGLARAAYNRPSGERPMPSIGAMMGETADTSTMMGSRTMADMMGGSGPDMAMNADMMTDMPADRVFALLGDTCTACHTKFRVEKD